MEEKSRGRSDDLLFVRSNGNKALIGRCVLVSGITEPVSFSGFTIRGRVKSDEIDHSFASKLVRSPLFKEHLHRMGGGSSINNLSQDTLSEFCFSLPPLPEQRKIAEILRTWDEAIEKLEALRAVKEQQFRGLQQKLIDQDFKSYGDTLEQYALIPNLEKITSADGLKSLTVKLHCKGIMANGRNVPVTLSDKGRPYYRRKSGDFLIGRQNFHNGGFGIVPQELDGFIASNAITSLESGPIDFGLNI